MNRNRNPIGTATIALLATSLIVGFVAPSSGQAQRKGATASIRVGEVVAQERVDLKDDSAKKGALIGGACMTKNRGTTIDIRVSENGRDSSRAHPTPS